MTNWYAVYTRPRCERKVAEGFLKRTWESYCPLSKPARSWTGLKTTATALFPSYVFVRLEKAQLAEVKKADSVVNLVYWLGEPVMIRDIEIEMIRRFLNVHKAVLAERTDVMPMAMVQLAEGTPPRQDANTKALTPGARLLLPSLGYVLVSLTGPYAHQSHAHTLEPQHEQQPFAITQIQ